MKILQIISGRDVNGALVHCQLLAGQLTARGHQVTVMCRPNSWIWDGLKTTRIRCVASEMNRWPPSELRRTSQWVKREQFDVIHTHMSRAHTYGVLLRQLTGIPVVATAHNRHFQLHWRWNDLVIANSEATRRFHYRVNWVNRRKLRTIRCFIDMPRFAQVTPQSVQWIRREWRLNREQPVIGIVGDVTRRKGHRYLFQSLPGLVEQFPDLKLMVIGRFHRDESYVRKLRRFLIRNRLYRRVRWLGRRDDIPEIMSALDVLVVPSLEEPLGLVPLEAMAVGTPVVASRTGGLVEVVNHEVNGLLFPARSPRSIETAVARVLTEPGLQQRMVEQGKTWVRQQFSPQVLTGEIEDALTTASQIRRAA